MIQPAPLPPATLTRYWFCNAKGAINVELEDNSNVVEVRVRLAKSRAWLVKRLEKRENTGAWNSPQLTSDWQRIIDALQMSTPGWKSERSHI